MISHTIFKVTWMEIKRPVLKANENVLARQVSGRPASQCKVQSSECRHCGVVSHLLILERWCKIMVYKLLNYYYYRTQDAGNRREQGGGTRHRPKKLGCRVWSRLLFIVWRGFNFNHVVRLCRDCEFANRINRSPYNVNHQQQHHWLWRCVVAFWLLLHQRDQITIFGGCDKGAAENPPGIPLLSAAYSLWLNDWLDVTKRRSVVNVFCANPDDDDRVVEQIAEEGSVFRRNSFSRIFLLLARKWSAFVYGLLIESKYSSSGFDREKYTTPTWWWLWSGICVSGTFQLRYLIRRYM